MGLAAILVIYVPRLCVRTAVASVVEMVARIIVGEYAP